MNPTEQVTEYPVTLDIWNCTLSVLVTTDGIYLPLRQLCAVLGLADAQFQAEQLQERKATRKYMRKLPIMTGRGKRLAWCLHRKLVGYWLGYISTKRLRPEIADSVIEFQEDVIEAANNCLFQEATTSFTVDSSIIPITRRLGPIRGPIIFSEDDDA